MTEVQWSLLVIVLLAFFVDVWILLVKEIEEFMGNITINGKTWSGRNIQIRNGRVKIDGKEVSDESGAVTLKVEVTGDIQSLKTDGDVRCGSVLGYVDAGGSVTVSGAVNRGVTAGGSISCGDVDGSVAAGGSVQCGKVLGNVDAGGSIMTTP